MASSNLALGAIEIYTTCLRGYTIVTAALTESDDQQLLYQRMRTQRARLTVWGENWGIDPHTAAASRHHPRYSSTGKLQSHLESGIRTGNEILDTLNAIADLFVNGRVLHDAYGLAKIAEAQERRELRDPDVADIALNGISRLPMSKLRLDKNRLAIDYLGHCRWIIHDPSRFEILLERLRHHTDDLYNLSPPQSREMMDRALVAELLAGHSHVQTLLHIHNAAADDAADRSPPTKGFFSDSYMTLSQAAKLRARAHIDPFLRRRLIRPPTVLVREDFVLHPTTTWNASNSACLATTAHLPERLVLIEFSSYLVAKRPQRRLEDSIHSLAELLAASSKPAEFRLLPCSGYFHDATHGRYGFVYDLPSYLRPSTPSSSLSLRRPTTLHSLLHALRDPIDLGARFTLAKQLLATLHIIHACGFTHKNIRPSSILFLAAESSDRKGPSKSRRVALNKPFLMGWGVNVEEPDKAHEREKDLYSHPTRLRYPARPYIPAFDIFALGVVLLEIGLWQSADSFAAEITDFSTEEFRNVLRKRVVPDLRSQCGAVYEGVVQQCLGISGEEGRDLKEEREMEKMLVWDLMRGLWGCSA
ncbi:prion-inhibition and propagation-domain-containing protein [Tricharina praecox]|uniref:prion-inhibition and propagation-domain-containing protein n=1 Tax=Tricharina praecox TaxID=43433 RepID=UPI00221E8ACE|nr:prion-inhibition and propagation-domain-containing protein [Tricharina praecox]KAI5855514.1 prion-inhibition and propagation-domain-containing protein [Tricharina praecox]